MNARAFTLIETLVALTIIVFAVSAPMTLASQSLSSAFYARDQITASHLAQEAIEVIRARRDANAIAIAQGDVRDVMLGIPVSGSDFIVNAIDGSMDSAVCIGGACPVLQNNGSLYGYGPGTDWRDTRFTRTVRIETVDSNAQEYRVVVVMKWQSGFYAVRTFTLKENLYRWIEKVDNLQRVDAQDPNNDINSSNSTGALGDGGPN
jgi:prepilin-type N-terminal cleavage/methylation domain-containing protein